MQRPRRRAAEFVRTALLYALLIVTSIVFAFPLVWITSTSLKTPDEANSSHLSLLPSQLQWDAYEKILTEPEWRLYFSNSLFVTALAVFGTLASISAVAYAFSRLHWPGRNVVFFLMLSTLMLPPQITLVPQYVIFNRLGWVGTFNPITLPGFFAGGALYIFLLRQFMLGLPRDLDEAALVDGASHLQIWWYIILPLCKPALATIGVFLFVANWNALQAPLIYLQRAKLHTLPIAASILYNPQQVRQDWPLIMGVALVTVLPLLLIFILLQHYFVEGIATTGRKG